MSDESKDIESCGRNSQSLELGSVRSQTNRRETIVREDDKWNFGCCRLDRRCVQYFAQLGLLSICIATSLYQVSTSNNNREFWISLLSSCVGVIVPSPKLKK